MNPSSAKTVDEYINMAPDIARPHLQQIRILIQKAAPTAEETISYQMPAYKLEGSLVYFGAAKNHLGFYPHPSGIENFRDLLQDYVCSKGAIQFPYSRPLPKKLVQDIVRFRIAENQHKAATKKKK